MYPRGNFDVSVSKKQLFSTATGTTVAPSTAARCSASRPPAAPPRATLPNRMTYQQKEDRLCTRPFDKIVK